MQVFGGHQQPGRRQRGLALGAGGRRLQQYGPERETERERERERETERDRQRETERERERGRQRETERKTESVSETAAKLLHSFFAFTSVTIAAIIPFGRQRN